MKYQQLKCVAGPVSCTNSISKCRYINFWVGLIHAYMICSRCRACEDWKSKSISNLTTTLSEVEAFMTSWFKNCMCNSRWEQLFVAFLNLIGLILMLLQLLRERRKPMGLQGPATSLLKIVMPLQNKTPVMCKYLVGLPSWIYSRSPSFSHSTSLGVLSIQIVFDLCELIKVPKAMAKVVSIVLH